MRLVANFYIADTHFGHGNILKLDARPFADLAEMEAVLIQNWNRAVTERDTVYILGDFIWGKDQNRWLDLTGKLQGKKVLIRGNHDLGWEAMSLELLAQFETVADYLEIRDEGRRVVLCHYPILFYHGSYSPNCYMLCGHVHATPENHYLETWRAQLQRDSKTRPNNQGNIINVGCMMPWMGYIPRRLSEIVTEKP